MGVAARKKIQKTIAVHPLRKCWVTNVPDGREQCCMKNTEAEVSKSKSNKNVRHLCVEDTFSSVQFSSVAQSCPTLCNPMDDTVCEILQARILEWVTFLFSKGSSQPRNWTQVSCIAGRFCYHLSYQGSLTILEGVVYPLSRGIFPT